MRRPAAHMVFVAVFLALLADGRAEARERGHAGGKGPLVSMEMRDVELNDLMRAIGRESGLNIIVGEGVGGRVTARLKDVPLWEALDSILTSRGLTYRRLENGLVLIEPAGETAREKMGLTVREFRLDYLEVSDVAPAVKDLLSRRGSVSLLKETNSLVVKDISLCVERVGRLLAGLDRRPRQVLIEARIVEISTAFRRELGVNWGGGYGYASGDVFGGLGRVEGNFALNLPSATEEGLMLGFGLISDRVMLDGRLAVLEGRGEAKVVSSPRIMVLDNHKAVISDGTEILIPSTGASTVIKTGDSSVSEAARQDTFSAAIELAVTPRVISDGRISMRIDTRREEFDFKREVQGFPPKITRTAVTELILKDGHTVVIGGIAKFDSLKGRRRVPVLSSIPLLGWLFRSDLKGREERELLIFITPNILRESMDAGEGPSGDIQD